MAREGMRSRITGMESELVMSKLLSIWRNTYVLSIVCRLKIHDHECLSIVCYVWIQWKKSCSLSRKNIKFCFSLSKNTLDHEASTVYLLHNATILVVDFTKKSLVFQVCNNYDLNGTKFSAWLPNFASAFYKREVVSKLTLV